jgi:hypothetical protein
MTLDALMPDDGYSAMNTGIQKHPASIIKQKRQGVSSQRPKSNPAPYPAIQLSGIFRAGDAGSISTI